MRRPRVVAAGAIVLALVATVAVATAAPAPTPVPSTIRLGAVHRDDHPHAVEATVVRAATDLAPTSATGSFGLVAALTAALAVVCCGGEWLRIIARRAGGLGLTAATAARGPPRLVRSH